MPEDKKLIRTPFYDYHIKVGAKMVEFAGFDMPIQYEGIVAEHKAVRENVGLFDLTHMGEFEVTGSDALAFLEKTTTNNVAALKPGEIHYSCMPNEQGGIVDDLLVYRMDDSFFLVVNASNMKKDFDWLSSQLFGNTKLINRSAEFGLLAIQGPNAQNLLQELTEFDLEAMPFYTHATAKIAGRDIFFSRTGYTGEDGFELYITEENCDHLLSEIQRIGEPMGMKPIGLGARDSLRLEMKMALYGNDIDDTTSPIEASLGWICNLDKDFIGSEIVKKHKAEKPKRRLICLELEGRVIPRHGYEIISNDEVVGVVTSGTFSPSLEKPIALGYLPLKLAKTGSEVEVAVRNKKFKAVVVKPPFYKNGSRR